MVGITVNGVAFNLVPTKKQSLLSWLRDELNLTTLQEGCGQGICGSCTVVLNREPVLSCLMTLEDLQEGDTLQTFEGLEPARRDAWHQRFAPLGRHGCGDCLPGLALRAESLIDRAAPDAIEDARERSRLLNFHLCRCHASSVLDQALQSSPALEADGKAWEHSLLDQAPKGTVFGHWIHESEFIHADFGSGLSAEGGDLFLPHGTAGFFPPEPFIRDALVLFPTTQAKKRWAATLQGSPCGEKAAPEEKVLHQLSAFVEKEALGIHLETKPLGLSELVPFQVLVRVTGATTLSLTFRGQVDSEAVTEMLACVTARGWTLEVQDKKGLSPLGKIPESALFWASLAAMERKIPILLFFSREQHLAWVPPFAGVDASLSLIHQGEGLVLQGRVQLHTSPRNQAAQRTLAALNARLKAVYPIIDRDLVTRVSGPKVTDHAHDPSLAEAMATFLLETALERLAVEAKEDGWEFRTRIWPFSEELGALDCGVRQCLVQRPTENYGLALGRNTRGGLQALLIFLSETGEWKGSCFVGSQPQAEATGLSLLALDAGVEQGLGLALTEVWHSAAETQGKWGKYGLYRQQGRPRVEAVWIGIADATESALTLAHAVKCLTPAALGCAWMRQSGQERFSWPMGKQGLFPRKRRR